MTAWRNRLIGAAIGIAIAAVWLARQSTHAPASGWNVLPEDAGSLQTIALQYTKAAGPDIRPPYRAFLSAIDPSTSVIAVCGDQADAVDLDNFLRSCPECHGDRVRKVVVGAPITAWCKDRFLVTGSTPAALLTPKPPVTGLAGRDNDAQVAAAIARAFPGRFRVVPTGMYFDSGDIVATPTRLIVSDSLWRKNAGNPVSLSSTSRTAHRPVGPVPPGLGVRGSDFGPSIASPAPLSLEGRGGGGEGHPGILGRSAGSNSSPSRFGRGGEERTGVGSFDRTLAAEFGRRVVHLHGVPDHHIGMFAAPLDDRTVIVGDPSMARPLWNPTLDHALGKADFSPRIDALFSNAAAELRAAGFRVIRAPLVYFGPQEYLTYTNAVLETRGGRRIVYMPSYDVPALDDLGRDAYESAGWQVRPIPVRTLYRYRGTIGCLINVLQRG